MKNKPVYKKREKLPPSPSAGDPALDSKKLKHSVEELRRVLMDPNQTPLMETFIELE